MTPQKKTEPFFEPCMHPKCNLRFGSPETLAAHHEEHRQEIIRRNLPRPEHQAYINPVNHARRLLDRIGIPKR